MERLILFGGTFDPVHWGHLRIAREASLRYNADVVFLPNKTPRWKTPGASASDRLAMLRLALEEDGSSSFRIDDRELKRSNDVSYTIDTIREYRKKYPHYELYFLMGADEVNLFPKWKDPEEIANNAHLIYSGRPQETIDPKIIQKYHFESLEFEGSGEVSSSAIRSLHSVDVPSKVLSYIEEHQLYFIPKVHAYLKERRFQHSLSVAHVAYAIASTNHLPDPGRAYIAGILHDIGKELPYDRSKAILKEAYPEYEDYPSFSWHQFTGAYLAEHDFDIKDQSILDAILYHCTGKAHMAPLLKIIFSADKIEPTRGYDSSALIKACLKDYYVGFLEVIQENAKFLDMKGGKDSTELSRECYAEYLNPARDKKRKQKI